LSSGAHSRGPGSAALDYIRYVSTLCEIVAEHGGCGLAAVDWCRACDRATCASHRRRASDNAVSVTVCRDCFDAMAVPQQLAEQLYRDALGDITAALRALHAEGCPGAALATKRAARRPLLHPWTPRVEPVFSLRYWPVGSYNWVESRPGGYGEHDLFDVGVRRRATVINERGQITRASDEEIVAGHASLARLQSEVTDIPQIARSLRSYLAS
jgi:hypothetical protein